MSHVSILYRVKKVFESTDSWLNVVRQESRTGCQVGSEIGKVWHWPDKVNRSGISRTTSKSNDQLPGNSRTHLSNFRNQSSIVSDSWKWMSIGQIVKLQSRSVSVKYLFYYNSNLLELLSFSLCIHSFYSFYDAFNKNYWTCIILLRSLILKWIWTSSLLLFGRLRTCEGICCTN